MTQHLTGASMVLEKGDGEGQAYFVPEAFCFFWLSIILLRSVVVK